MEQTPGCLGARTRVLEGLLWKVFERNRLWIVRGPPMQRQPSAGQSFGAWKDTFSLACLTSTKLLIFSCSPPLQHTSSERAHTGTQHVLGELNWIERSSARLLLYYYLQSDLHFWDFSSPCSYVPPFSVLYCSWLGFMGGRSPGCPMATQDPWTLSLCTRMILPGSRGTFWSRLWQS